MALAARSRWGGWSTQCRRGDVALCEVSEARCSNPAHQERKGGPAEPELADVTPLAAMPDEVLDDTMLVARTIVTLWHAGVMKRDTSLSELATVCEVPVTVVNAANLAWHRANGGEPRRTKTLAPGRKDVKRCSKCDTWKPLDDFNVANRRTGKLNGWCKQCTSIYQRARYISAREMGLLGAARALLTEGHPFVGSLCPCCGEPLVVGQEVSVADLELRHADCTT